MFYLSFWGELMRLILALAFILSQTLLASDHIDGVPSLGTHEQVDLTDLYAFKSPGKANSLTIILNTYPGVKQKGHFSSKVGYEILIREALPGTSPRVAGLMTDASQEAKIRCTFIDPHHHHYHSNNKKKQLDTGKINCQLMAAGKAAVSLKGKVGRILNHASADYRLFSGARSDAFFINSEMFKQVTGRKGFQAIMDGSGENVMESINVLSMALEFDLKLLFDQAQGKMFAISAQSFTGVTGNKKVLDRVGRPEITNLSLHFYKGAGSGVKYDYNQLPAFTNTLSQGVNKFRTRIEDNIAAYDRYNGIVDWPSSRLANLSSILMDDYLVINMDSSCIDDPENNYLTIEKQLLKGELPMACGGRRLKDDIMAAKYALYIGGLEAEPSDYKSGVDVPYQNSAKQLSANFPYLVAPERTNKINIKRFLLNTLLKRKFMQDKEQ